jgi:hypothetical protein
VGSDIIILNRVQNRTVSTQSTYMICTFGLVTKSCLTCNMCRKKVPNESIGCISKYLVLLVVVVIVDRCAMQHIMMMVMVVVSNVNFFNESFS